jgi:lysophospholipase L1-like esterase
MALPSGADRMGIVRATALTASILAGAAVASGVSYFGLDAIWPQSEPKAANKPFTERARQTAEPQPDLPRKYALATIVGDAPLPPPPRSEATGALPEVMPVAATPATAAPDAEQPSVVEPPPPLFIEPPAPGAQSAEIEDDGVGDVTPTLEGRAKGGPGKRGLVILHIGDSHTSADFLTGELRKRLQARYGRGAPGYITAGHPHIGVRSSSLNVKASSGWTYKSLQRPDAATSEFWLSGYNAIVSAPGETMSFTADKPQLFDTIEIEVVRQPGGGAIDVKLDGVVETSYDLSSSKIEPVVIRLVPARAATEKVREIAITTKGHGAVMIASLAIYNRQSGLTYNSVGYPGAQASLINKFNTKLLANDLLRINPQIVVLSFGTNEASNDGLDIAKYTEGYERIVNKIKTTLPAAQIVVIGPPDFSEQPGSGKKDKASGRVREANADGKSAASDCAWHTPARLGQVREAQREVAQRLGLVYWNWASIMPSECGAHRWFTASPPLMAKDHVHFTIEGYRKSADQFLNTLIPVIEKVRVSANAVPNN